MDNGRVINSGYTNTEIKEKYKNAQILGRLALVSIGLGIVALIVALLVDLITVTKVVLYSISVIGVAYGVYSINKARKSASDILDFESNIEKDLKSKEYDEITFKTLQLTTKLVDKGLLRISEKHSIISEGEHQLLVVNEDYVAPASEKAPEPVKPVGVTKPVRKMPSDFKKKKNK